MKSYLLLIMMGFLGITNIKAQKPYFHPAFDSITAGHRSIAILPFDVIINLRPVEQNQLREGDLGSMEKQESLMLQKSLDAYLFKQSLRGKFNIHVQDIDSTDDLLKTKGWTRDSISHKSLHEVSILLGVDAVISGSLSVNRPISMEVSNALELATGIPLPTISGDCDINLYNSHGGELIWHTKETFMKGSSDMKSIIITLMKRASRKLPYSNKR